MKSVGRVLVLLTLMSLLTSLSPVPEGLAAQQPFRVDRFAAATAPRPLPGRVAGRVDVVPRGTLVGLRTCAEDPACVSRTMRAGIGGYLAAAGVMVATFHGVLDACWEFCDAWIPLAWASPLAILPPLFMHLGSGRSGSLPVTLSVSLLTFSAALALAVYNDSPLAFLGGLGAQFALTAAFEIHWPRRDRPAGDP